MSSRFAIILYPRTPDPDAPSLGHWTCGLNEEGDVITHIDPTKAELFPTVKEAGQRLLQYVASPASNDGRIGFIVIGMGPSEVSL